MSAPCVVLGCGEDARRGAARCDVHDRERRARHDHTRPSAAERGYDARWRTTRARTLASRPWCECAGCPRCHRPGTACLRPAVDIDHLDGQGPHGPLGHDQMNLQPLCHPCHSSKTGRDQRR